MSDTTNRQRWKAALAPTPECLSIEQLATYRERMSGPADPRMKNHVSICPRCQTELKMLSIFESTTPIAEEGAAVAWISSRLQTQNGKLAGVPQSSSPAGWRAWIFGTPVRALSFAGTAALVLFLAASFYWRLNREPELRADATRHDQSVFRSQEIATEGGSGDLPQAPSELAWRVVPGAASYSIQLMEVDHSTFWTGQAADRRASIPPEVRAKMLPGKTILWQVVARDAQGNQIAASPVQRFRVATPKP